MPQGRRHNWRIEDQHNLSFSFHGAIVRIVALLFPIVSNTTARICRVGNQMRINSQGCGSEVPQQSLFEVEWPKPYKRNQDVLSGFSFQTKRKDEIQTSCIIYSRELTRNE